VRRAGAVEYVEAMRGRYLVVIGGGFTKHFISWTREEVNNLPKPGTPWYNRDDWEIFQGKQSSYGVSFTP